MKFDEYKKLNLGVDCVIMTSDLHKEDNCRMEARRALQVLMIKRNIEPFNGHWSIPGGLVEYDKGLEETINTKLFKKTNISQMYKEQLYTYGDNTERDPRGRVVSVAYLALVNKEQLQNIQTKDYGEVKWFWVAPGAAGEAVFIDPETSVEVKNIAFDHAKIVNDAILRIRNKVAYTDIIFKMMPKKFTMRELQDLYEFIIGKGVYSFRKLMQSKVYETDEYSATKAHRPAKLFVYKEVKSVDVEEVQ